MISDFQIDEGVIDLELDKQQLTIRESHLKTPVGRIDVNGGIANIFDKNDEKRLTLHTAIHNLNPFGMSKWKDIPGNLNIEMTVEATIPHSWKLTEATTQVTARLASSSVAKLRIQQASLQGSWRDKTFFLEDFDLSTEIAKLSALGSIVPLQKHINLQTEMDIPEIRNLVAHLHETLPSMTSKFSNIEALGGNLALSAELVGIWNDPEISFTASGKDLGYREIIADTTQLKGKFSGFSKELTGSMSVEMDKLGMKQANFPYAKAQVDLAKNNMMMDLLCTHENGLEASIKGNVDSWRKPTKDITIIDLQMNFNDMELATPEPIQLQLSKESFQITPCDLRLNETTISISGGLEKVGDESVTIDVGELDLQRLLPSFSKNLELRGSCSVNAELTGWLDHITVTTSIRGDSLTYEKLHADSLAILVTTTLGSDPEKIRAETKLRVKNFGVYNELFPQLEIDSNITPDSALVELLVRHKNGSEFSLKGSIESWSPPTSVTISELMITADDIPIVNNNPIKTFYLRQCTRSVTIPS